MRGTIGRSAGPSRPKDGAAEALEGLAVARVESNGLGVLSAAPSLPEIGPARSGVRMDAWRGRRRGQTMLGCLEKDNSQLHRMLVIAFLLLLVPATIARLTGWRWRPWPPGPEGYSSIIGEARAAADTYVPLGFTGW